MKNLFKAITSAAVAIATASVIATPAFAMDAPGDQPVPVGGDNSITGETINNPDGSVLGNVHYYAPTYTDEQKWTSEQKQATFTSSLVSSDNDQMVYELSSSANFAGTAIQIVLPVRLDVFPAGTAVIVIHNHGGNITNYDATVAENGTVTFTNREGFSTFTIVKKPAEQAAATTAPAWVNPILQEKGYKGYTPEGKLVTSLGDNRVVDEQNIVWDANGNKVGVYDWATETVVSGAAAPAAAPAASANGRYLVPNTGVK